MGAVRLGESSPSTRLAWKDCRAFRNRQGKSWQGNRFVRGFMLTFGHLLKYEEGALGVKW